MGVQSGKAVRPFNMAPIHTLIFLALAGQALSECTWEVKTNHGLNGRNDKKISGSSVDQCKKACEEETSFQCKSFDFNKLFNFCHLSASTTNDAGLIWWFTYDYYEAKCGETQRKCYCYGDPHCYSFDGTVAHFQGTCKYTMARDGCTNGVPSGDSTWEVVTNHNRQNPRATVSYVREVTVILDDYNLVVEMFPAKRVLVNGAPMLGSPLNPHADVTISKTWSKVYVTVKGKIQVSWDGNSQVIVEMSADYDGKTCGICGNSNGNGGDDWVVGSTNMCMSHWPSAQVGQTTNDLNMFGYSWTHSIDKNEQSCIDTCPNPPPAPVCDGVNQQKAEEHCKILRDPNGPFKECLAAMDAAQKDSLFENCVYDACALKDYENTICTHAASTAKVCKTDKGITVSWRTADRCPMECGEGMEYKACGSSCMPTCSDRQGTGCGDTGDCDEGCFCKAGMVYDGENSCIPESSCGCKVPDQGVFINVGESYLSSDCSQHCACEKAGAALKCTSHSCGANFVCATTDGDRKCACKAPFILSGNNCMEPTTTPPPTTTTTAPPTTTTEGLPSVCTLKKDPGNCEDFTKRYFYSAKTNKCKKFNYGRWWQWKQLQ